MQIFKICSFVPESPFKWYEKDNIYTSKPLIVNTKNDFTVVNKI